MKKILIIIFTVMVFSVNVYANDYIFDNLDILNIEKYDTVINNNIYGIDFKFSDFIKDVVFSKGFDVKINKILNYILKILFEEVFINYKIIKNIILIALLSSFFKILTESFKNKGIAEIGFYTNYIVIAMILINAFNVIIDIVYGVINGIYNIINAVMPILVSLLFMSGASGSATIFSSFILMSLTILSFFMKNVFIPLISSTFILNIINYITPKEILNKLIEFLRWIITFSLRSIALGLGFIISMQRLGAPILNGAINRTAKTFISFVPVIGDAMTGAVDSIMYFVGFLKGGIGIGIFVAIILCFIIPIIKLVSIIIIYKITAVLIEPISDNRITSSVDTISEYGKIVLSSLMIFLVLFIFFIAIMLTVTG